MEGGNFPTRMSAALVREDISRLSATLRRLIDNDIFPWLTERREPSLAEAQRAATIIADRLCSAKADPIVRNAQEENNYR